MALVIDILTIFPEMFQGPFSASILGRAQDAGIVDLRIHDARRFARDRHRTMDDTPYGGGGGMVMKPEPLVEAIETVRADGPAAPDADRARTVYLTPQGRPYDQQTAERFARLDHLVLVCGHYEEMDERVRRLVIDEEISIGDYILTGGEIPAMVVVDSVVRLLPGAVGNPESLCRESFRDGLLDHPHYTRPEVFRGLRVPEVLLSGHHAEIEKWRRREALKRTWQRRPDLLERAALTDDDRRILEQLNQSVEEESRT